ncbi:MAG: hypothetical protein HY057_01425 [Rhodospirillales bacterium]|nr:hypothetical protein [Rhodospirillales bacterium]
MKSWIVVALALAAPAAAQSPSPYAGQENRAIKALSDAEIEDLKAGNGAGFAKTAELNSYPGPAHVLELAGPLALGPDQRAASEALLHHMRAEAQKLGAKILDAEAALERAFAGRRITRDELRARLAAIAALQGELRAAHLETHIAQQALLSPEQVARYDVLRGYASASTSAPAPAGGAQHRQH